MSFQQNFVDFNVLWFYVCLIKIDIYKYNVIDNN